MILGFRDFSEVLSSDSSEDSLPLHRVVVVVASDFAIS